MTAVAASVCSRFGMFELRPRERLLRARGQDVHLGPRAFDVLIVLVERSGQLVTKEELFQRVWPRVIVEENTLQVHVSALRKVLGAEAIATVSGRGYRFTPQVTHVAAAATNPVTTPAHNLPYDLTSFIGREKEIADLAQWLDSARLVTLTGSGGCGKTRLAIELARRQAHAYPDGAWLAELGALTDAALLPQTVSSVLGLKERPGEKLIDTIGKHLASRALLLVLDNAEHLLEACAQLAESLLRRCARLVVLVTTREPLSITGELIYRVPSLSVPDEDDTSAESIAAHESARLFIERARLQQPQFAITTQNSAAIAAICRRLDGIALALELAAPRLRNGSVEELSHRLDRCFEVLTEGSRTALPRHRTLRALIDWSYDLLDDAEQTMLRRVSVFSGGWTLEAAQHVCFESPGLDGAVAELLDSLADKSLVSIERSGDVARYSLLETVREYARLLLYSSGEEPAARRAHLASCITLAETAETRLVGAEQREWLERLEVDRENLRSALSFAASCRDAGGLVLAASLWRFWLLREYLSEGRTLLEEQLAQCRDDADPAVRAKALHGAAIFARRMGNAPRAIELGEESLRLRREAGDQRGIAATLGGLANVLFNLGDYAKARAGHEESLAIYMRLGDQDGIASGLNNLGLVLSATEDFDGARSIYESAITLFEARHDQWGHASTLANLAGVEHAAGRLGQASALFKEAASRYRDIGDQLGLARALRQHANVACELGDVRAGLALVEESMAMVEDRVNTCQALHVIGMAVAEANPEAAVTIWSAYERAQADLGLQLPPHVVAWEKSHLERARAAIADDARFARACGNGRALSLQEAAGFAKDSAGSIRLGLDNRATSDSA